MSNGTTVEKLSWAFAYGAGMFVLWLCALSIDRVFRCQMIAKLEIICNNPVFLVLIQCMRCFTRTRWFASDTGIELTASQVLKLRSDQTIITFQPNSSDHISVNSSHGT